jgi:hypothetical protein
MAAVKWRRVSDVAVSHERQGLGAVSLVFRHRAPTPPFPPGASSGSSFASSSGTASGSSVVASTSVITHHVHDFLASLTARESMRVQGARFRDGKRARKGVQATAVCWSCTTLPSPAASIHPLPDAPIKCDKCEAMWVRRIPPGRTGYRLSQLRRPRCGCAPGRFPGTRRRATRRGIGSSRAGTDR